MTAISFFSYKGGVGRTMALTNMAMRLVEFGKSVMIIDFDLEAPGVPYKLGKYLKPDDIKTGLVDYIHEFSSKGQLGNIKDYVKELPRNNPGDASLYLLPAGDTNMSEYWNKLSRINWHDMFYVKGGKGVRFFLDLKEKIRKQYNPDFILIDSRTGITELSGISLKILADEVVLMFVNNEENIKGTERVLEFLYSKDESEKEPKINLVITRIPHPNTAFYPDKITVEYNREYNLLKQLSQSFSVIPRGQTHVLNVIHTDERLQMDEKAAFSLKYTGNGPASDIYTEHLYLFEKIFKDKLSNEEWETHSKNAYAVKCYVQALNENKSMQRRISLLNTAIAFDSQKWEYYSSRGAGHLSLYDYEKAIEDIQKSIELSKGSYEPLLLLTWAFYRSKKYNEALQTVNKVLIVKKYDLEAVILKALILDSLGDFKVALNWLNELSVIHSNSFQVFNARAIINRRLKNYNNALSDIYKAISIFPDPICYVVLAEIYSDMNRIEDFFVNLSAALSKGITLNDFRTSRDAYTKFRYDERFIELLRSYNMNSEDIFHDGPPITGDGDSNFDEEPAFLDLK